MPISAVKLANIRLFHEEINSPRKDGSTANAPLLVAIHATTRCNFRCVHCSQTFTKQPPADMSLELFQEIVPMFRTAHQLLLFGDGEVLLNIPRHLAMISRVYQHNPGCELGFSTNGKLLTPEVYELYSTAGVQYIQLSVDAGTQELYETMRRGGNFNELLANLEGIAALRLRSTTRQPALWLATVISRQNYHELPLLAQFARKYGFSYWYINAEYPHNPGRDLFQLTAQDRVELTSIRADIMQSLGTSCFTHFDPSIGLPSLAEEPWLKSKPAVFCTVPWQHFEMLANGDIKICPYYHEPVCSVNGKTPQEVWNGDEFRRIRKAFASGVDIPPYCINCKQGLRTQYLPGFPGIPEPPELSLFDRMIRPFSALTKHISRIKDPSA